MTVLKLGKATHAMPWMVVAALAACGGNSASERRSGAGGESPRTGGTSSGGTSNGGAGATAGAATRGGSPSGGAGAGGNPLGGSNAGAGLGGDAGAAMGGTGADGGGDMGGSPSGGEGGDGNCVDVCALHGGACCIPNVDCVEAGSSCLFEVLAARLGSAYAYAELEQRVAALPQDLLLAFTVSDIESAAADPAPAARFEFRMSAEMARLHAGPLQTAELHPFKVSCNGQQLFVGVVYMLEGAAAFDAPVLDPVVDEENPLTLRLGARMPSWYYTTSVSLESKQRIDRSELRAALCLGGPLGELPPPRP